MTTIIDEEPNYRVLSIQSHTVIHHTRRGKNEKEKLDQLLHRCLVIAV